MERFLIPSIYLGAVSGVIFGILLLIPFISPFIFFLMFILSGIGVIVFLKRHRAVGMLSVYDGCILGAVAGFISLVSASVIYVPKFFIFGKFFSLKGYDILAVIMLVFCTALLSALFNGFAGLVTAYIYEKIETKHFSFKDHFELDVEREENE